jgi:hypothetical protein
MIPCSVFRLFDCRHLHCTGTAIRVSRMSCGPGQCAQGSQGRCGCAQCRQARPAAVVCARTHTSTHVQRCASTHTQAPVRTRTHTSTRAQRRLREAHTQLAQLPYPPHIVFRSQLTLSVFGDRPHEQYLSDPWASGHAVLCLWKPERRPFTHSKCHARLLSVRFFRSQSESSRPYEWGVGLTQQICYAKTICKKW